MFRRAGSPARLIFRLSPADANIFSYPLTLNLFSFKRAPLPAEKN
jgi:hypothetical protein